MPLKLDFKRVYSALSERVKCTDLHPVEPWILVALYTGQVNIHNYETQTIVKSFDTGQTPVRSAVFVARKNWVICGSDDLIIRVFNYNTLEKVFSFEAHVDYLRYVLVHPSRSLLITSSDDMLIKVWDWDKRWECVQVFEGHSHYVMQLALNPKDHNQIASASLDKKIKVWQLGSNSRPNFTLEGHDKGVNSVDYCHSGDKPYLISAADDWFIKVWDYQNKSCVHTLSGHTNNVVRAVFHPTLPLIISASEDGSARVWNTSTFRCELTLNHGMGRMWSISLKKDSNEIAFGYDDGALLLRVGKETPTCTMDSTGKIFTAKQTSILHANTKLQEGEFRNGEKQAIPYKELGTCEFYPQVLLTSPNGRYLAVLGDGEYVIYTTIAFRSKLFGSAESFAWCYDSSSYAIKDGSNVVLFKNFKEHKKVRLNYDAEDFYGGALLGVKTSQEIYFYDWAELDFVIKIDIQPICLYWNPENTTCVVADQSLLHILKYDCAQVEKALSSPLNRDFGIPDAFQLVDNISENVLTGLWIGDCFIFTNRNNRISYLLGSQVFTIHHVERPLYLIGYLPNYCRLYLTDKEGNVVTYGVDMRLIEYEIAILKKDFDYAQQILPNVPKASLNQLSVFLEGQGLIDLALEVTQDLETKFDLAMRTNKLDLSYEIVQQTNNILRWKLLGKTSLSQCRFDMAIECFRKTNDLPSLLLLSVTLKNLDLLNETLKLALEANNINIAFLIFYMTNRITEAIELLKKSNMNAEAALMAYSYSPESLSTTFQSWQQSLAKNHSKEAERLADPSKYPNLFPQHSEILEQQMKNLSLGTQQN